MNFLLCFALFFYSLDVCIRPTDAATGTVADATPGDASIEGVTTVGTGVLVNDGATVQNTDDFISSVTLTGNANGSVSVSVNWYFSSSGSYSSMNGVNIKVFVGGTNGWQETHSVVLTQSTRALDSFHTETFTLTAAQVASGDFVRVALQDRANSNHFINGFFATNDLGSHFDNVDTPMPTAGSLSGSKTYAPWEKPIRDHQITRSVINLGGGGPVQSVRVTIDELRHTWVGDLVISIRSPDGFTEVLRSRTGGSAQDILNESFLITSGALIGGSSGGDWELIIEDRATRDEGYLVKWSIEVEAQSSTVNQSGPIDIPLVIDGFTGNLTDVDVIIHELTTGSLAGLRVELVAPNGTSVLLFENIGGTGATMLNTIFSQESQRSINSGTGTFGDTFRPLGNLSSLALKGGTTLSPNGEWNLRITDTSADGGVPTNVEWALRFRTDEWVASTIEVANKGMMSDVMLNVQFSHATGNDLRFRLVGPTGHIVDLPQLSSWNNVTFDDDGVSGTLMLEELDEFRDTNANGTWRLEVRDLAGNREGILRSWSLNIASQATDIPLLVENQPQGATDVSLDVRLLPDTLNGRPLNLHGIGMSLLTPDGREITLFNSGTLSGSALGGALRAIRFSDNADALVTSGSAPYAGIFRPLELLNLVDEHGNTVPLDPNGEWVLRIFDEAGDIAGVVESWALNFSYEPIDGQALRASVVGDVNADGLDDIGFVVSGFRGEENLEQAMGRAFILGGRDLPNNSGIGAILTTLDRLSAGETIAGAITAGGSANARASAMLEIDGPNNNLLFRAINARAQDNGMAISVVYTPTQVEGVEVSYNVTTKLLTISIRGLGVNANDVITRLQTSQATGMNEFRDAFEVSLYSETQARLFTDSIWQVYGTNIAGAIQPLGDINNDGAADFALVRSREDAGNASGGILIYTGSANWRLPVTTATDAILSTFVRINQASLGEFGSTSIFSKLYVTAGDFNGDGMIDIVIGRPEFIRVSGQLDNYLPEQVLTSSTRGAAYIFFSITNRTTPTLQLRDAHIVIEGQGETDRFGVLPGTPFMDVNASGINDLFIGAPTANSSLGGVRVDAGRLYLIYGARTIERMPDRGFDILTNRSIAGAGSFLVDTGIGRPSAFFDADLTGDGNLDSSRYTLLPGEGSKWYRFTTLGDGALGDMIRLDPIAGVQTEQVIRGMSGVLTETGPEEFEVNLSGLGMTLLNPSDQAILEFDLTPYLGQLDNPSMIKRVILRLAGLSSVDVPLPEGITLISALGESELAFTVRTSDNRFELWRSDGTPFGSQRIAILANQPVALHTVGSQLFVVQYNPDNDRHQVWALNTARTGLVLESGIGQVVQAPTQFAGRDGRYYIVANGTVYTATAPGNAAAMATPAGVTRLLQTSDTEVYAMSATNLWRLEGATATIVERSAVVTGAQNLAAAGDWVFYRDELDGTNVVWFARLGGSTPNAEARPLATSTGGVMISLSEVIAIGEHLYLIGDATDGAGLWYLAPDGSAVQSAAAGLANPSGMIALSGNRLAFNYGTDFARNEIAVIDIADNALAAATTAALPTDAGNINTLYAFDNVLGHTGTTLMFAAENASGTEVAWQGTLTGSSLTLATFTTASGNPSVTRPSEFIAFDDEIYFVADSSLFGRELFSYNGARVALAADIRPGTSSSNPADLKVIGNFLYFTATAPDSLARKVFFLSDVVSGLVLDAPGADNALSFVAPDGVSNPTVSISTPIDLVGIMSGGGPGVRSTTSIAFSAAAITVTAKTPGATLNGTEIILVGSSDAGISVNWDGDSRLTVTYQQDGSTLGEIAAAIEGQSHINVDASSDAPSQIATSINTQVLGNELIIRVLPGVTTAADIVNYFAEGNPGAATNWTVSLAADSESAATNDGSGILLAGEYTVTGGSVATDNTRTLNLPGTSSSLVLSERRSGSALENLTIVWVSGSTTSASFDDNTDTLTLTYDPGETTVNDLAAVIGIVGGEVFGIPFRATVVGTGSDTLSDISGTFSTGTNEASAETTLALGDGTIVITVTAPGEAGNDIVFQVVGAYTDGDGTALNSTTPVAVVVDGKTVTIYALPGVATLGLIAAAIDEIEEFDAEVTAGTEAAVLTALELGGTFTEDNDNGTRTITFDDSEFTVTVGRDYTITINDIDFTVEATSADLEDLVAAWATAINDHGSFSASSDGLVISITEGAATATITIAVEPAQVTTGVTIELVTVDDDDIRRITFDDAEFTVIEGLTYTITIDGTPFSVLATDSTTLEDLVAAWAALIDDDGDYSATSAGVVIDITEGADTAEIEVSVEGDVITDGFAVAFIADAILVLDLEGETLTLTAGNSHVGTVVELDGSGSDGISISLSAGVLTIVYEAGVSTLGDIVDEITTFGTFTAVASDEDVELGFTASVETEGGVTPVAAVAAITLLDGTVLTLTSNDPTSHADFSGVVVTVLTGTTAGFDDDSGITLTLVDGATTITALNTLLADESLVATTDRPVEQAGDALIASLADDFEEGEPAVPASAEVRAPGLDNDFTIFASPRIEGYVVRFEDGGAGSGVNIQIVNGIIAIAIDFGTTTAADVVAALNAPFTYSFTLSGGNSSTAAAGTVGILDNVLRVAVKDNGSAFNGIRIVLVGDAVDSISAEWDGDDVVGDGNRTLTVSYVADQTTLGEIIAFINNYEDAEISAGAVRFEASLTTGSTADVLLSVGAEFLAEDGETEVHTGGGIINPATVSAGTIPTLSGDQLFNPRQSIVINDVLYFIGDFFETLEGTFGGGTSSIPAFVDMTIGGEGFRITASTNGTGFNDVAVSISATSMNGVQTRFSLSAGVLEITYQPGVSTFQDLQNAINALPNFSVSFDTDNLGGALLPANTVHLWRQTAAGADTVERVLPSSLTLSGAVTLIEVPAGLLIVDAANGIRLLNAAGELSTAVAAADFSQFRIMGGNQVALLESDGSVLRKHVVDGVSRSAVRSQPWIELRTAVAHDGQLYIAENTGTRDVLYRIDGTAASLVHTLAIGTRFEQLISVGDHFYFTTRSSSNALGLFHLAADDSVAAVTLSAASTVLNTTSSSGSFHSFVAVGDKIALVYSVPGANRLAVINTSEPTVATQVRDISAGTVSEMTVVGDRVYFRFGNARGSFLWTSDLTFSGTVRATDPRDSNILQAANPSQLVSFRGQLFFTAPAGETDGVFWVSIPDADDPTQIQTAPLVDLVDSVVPPLIISVLNDEGDGIVTAADGSAARTEILYSAESANQALIDVTEVVRAFLAAGKTRITFALSLNMEADAIPDDGFTIAHADTANGSQLQVVTGSVAAVTGSLFTAEGRLLQSNQPVIDLSQLPAGTYFLRVNGPTDAIEFIQRGTATIKADGTSIGSAGDYTYYIRENQLRRTNGFLGQTNFFDDVVRSGPAADQIVAGADLRLIGGAGNSFYFTRVETNEADEQQTVLWEISGVFAQRVGVLPDDADQWVAVGNTLVFNVGSLLYAVEGIELTELYDYEGALISGMESVAGRAVYRVTEVDDFGRWHATDGTVAGTIALDSVDARGQEAGDIVAAGGFLFYLAENNGKLTLWRATPGQGQNYGAEPLTIAALAQVDAVEWSILAVSNFNVLFTVTNSAGEVQLWISNGNGDGLLGGQQPGTVRIVDDLGGPASFVGVFENRMFFVVEGEDKQTLWSTEGTPELTFVVVEELPGEARNQVVWNGETYFIAGPNLSPLLWKLTDDGVEFVSFLPIFADNLTAAGNLLAFTALFVTDTETGDALYVTDGTEDGIRMVVELSPVDPGRITDIALTSNGIVFIVQNNDAILDGFVDYSLWISNGFRDGTYPILSSNAGTLPFGTLGLGSSEAIRPQLLKVVGAIAFYAFDGRIIATDGTASGTRILNPAEDINPVDVIESDGRLVVLDDQGRMWMTQGNLVGLPFRIEVKAPVPGRMHSIGDRDIIIGGEGNDILIGNGDHDIIFGGGGTNFFIAERKEIRDLQPFENFVLPPIEEFSFQQPRPTDTEVWIPDVNLRAAIARALNIPVTEGFDGRPVIHGKIMASQMATLVELQAPNSGIQSVVGLQFARNLKVLNLNGNRIEDLSILVPATDPVSGAMTGLSNLRIFSMDYNGMGILTFNGETEPGVGEYFEVDGLFNEIQMTVTFWFRTDNHGQAMGLFSMDSGTRGDGGLDRSIFLDEQGRIGAFIYGGADRGYEIIRSADDTNFADGNWHHVAYVYSSNTDVAQRLYVNGIEVALGTFTSSSLSIQDGFNVGFGYAVNDAPAGASIHDGGIPDKPGAPAYFKGDMDELRIWDAAFTDVLVNADMISSYPGERVALVGYWSFDQAPGGFVIDHSLFRRNGVMGGGNIERAPAFNFMQPDPSNRPVPGMAEFAGVGPERTLFQTIIRDLGRLNVPGPLEKISLAYTRIDVLDPLSNLPDLNYVNLKGVINPQESTLAIIVDHSDPSEPQTRLFTTKDGTVVAVEGNRTLVLSAGTWAWRRLTLGGGVDGDEHFELEVDELTNELIVRAFGEEQRFSLADFDQILFDGGNGDDSLTIIGHFPIDLYAFGGAGDDILMGGHGTNYLFGGAGNDTLIAQGGTSFLTGGRGDDTYIFHDNWGTAFVNENPNGGTDTMDFSRVSQNLIINVRGISRTADGLNTVAHEANTIERFIGGEGNDIMNLHREEGGLLELGDGVLIWDRVAITHSGIEKIDVRFVNKDGNRTGVVRVLADQDYSGRELRIEARGIDIRASIKAAGLSLQATNIIGISQNFNVETGLGRLITLEADTMRIAARNGVGDINMPLYVKAGTLEAQTEGAAGIYIVTLTDTIIGNVEFGTIGATTAGLKTGAGGNIHLVNLGGRLIVNEEIQASGGRVVITGERMDINANIASVREINGQTFRGTLVLQPLSTRTAIGMATAFNPLANQLHFSAAEINRFMNGFDSSSPATFLSNGRLVTLPAVSGINIGRADGRHVITLDTFTYTESFTFRAPNAFGRFDIIGTLTLAPSILDGQFPSLSFLGWRI